MLTKRSVGLVVDSNIIVDMALPHPGNTLNQILCEWLESLIGKMDVSTRGRAITLFVSSTIMDDYTTGLGSEKHSAAKTFKSHFKRRFARAITLGTPDKNRFLLKKVTPDLTRVRSPRVNDRYDQAYLDILVHIKNSDMWKDRAIIAASRDKVLLASLRDEAARGHETWFHIAQSMDDLEGLIRC